MSEIVPHLSSEGSSQTKRSYGAHVNKIDFGSGSSRPKVGLEDGRMGVGTCLGCSEPPCILRALSPATEIPLMAEFPQDPARDLCPTNAINIEDTSKFAVVDQSACVGCGLCVRGCPFGAINISANGLATVSHDDPDRLVIDGNPSPVIDTAQRIGRMGASTLPTLANMPNAIRTLSDVQALRFVANTFALLGVDARVRRRGDTNIRIDGLLGFDGRRIGVMELERTTNVVESPRALLEDVAILHSRYDIAIKEICPVSVIVSLPNARSEYYQVMQDIENVLGIQCRTITTGALVAMLWSFGKIKSFDGLFLTTGGGIDMRSSIAAIIGSVDQEPYPAAFITAK